MQEKNLQVLELLESVLGKGKPTGKGNYAFFSPFISHYKPKLAVKLDPVNNDYHWHCWVSDNGGRSLVSLFRKVGAPEDKVNKLKTLLGKKIYKGELENIFEEHSEQVHSVSLPDEYKPLWVYSDTPEYKNAMKYVLNRNITVFDILKYRIGYCDSGYYSDKIIIPSYDVNGKLNYFIARGYFEADKQAHMGPDTDKNIIGFEMHINWRLPIILCEGAFDAIAIRKNAIPLFGKNISQRLKLKIIEERVKEIYICLDADALANAVEIAQEFMNQGITVYLVELAEDDPGKLGFDNVVELIKKTEPLQLSNLLHYKLSNMYDRTSPDIKSVEW